MTLQELSLLGKHLSIISANILFLLQTRKLEEIIDTSTQHTYRDNWTRVDVDKKFLQPYSHDLDINALAVEIISTTDVDSEIHLHKNAYALVTLLGVREGVAEPDNCVYFFDSKSISHRAVSGITLHILPGMVHGFRSLDGTNKITFLSVQSKRINEDFYPV